MGKIENKKKFYIISAICLAVMLFFRYLPPIGQITPTGMLCVGIFLGCMIGWIAEYIITTSLMGLAVYALTMPDASFGSMLSGLFGNINLLMVITSLVYAYALQKCGLLDFLAKKILSTKLATKSVWHLSVMMWLASVVCTALVVNSFAVVIMLFSLYYSLAGQLKLEKKSPTVAFTLIGMAVLASISVGIAPYSSAVLVCIAIMSGVAQGVTYSIPLISGVNLIVVLGVFVIFCVAAKFLFKKWDSNNSKEIHVDMMELLTKGEFTPEIGLAIASIVLLLVILIAPIFLPKESALYLLLNRIGGNGCFMFISTIMAFIVFGDEPMFNLSDAMKNGCRWEVAFLLGTALYISAYLTSKDSGVLATLSAFMNSTIAGWGPYLAIALVILVGLVFTNVASNGAAIQLITPIMTIVLMNFGLSPAIIVGLLAVVLDHGLILPSGSVIGAFLHGDKEWLTTNQVLKYTSLGAISLFLVIALVALPIILATA